MVSNPHIGAILGFFGPGKRACFYALNTVAVVQDSICALVYFPLAPYPQARKNTRQEIAGFWGLDLLRITRLFSHKTGL